MSVGYNPLRGPFQEVRFGGHGHTAGAVTYAADDMIWCVPDVFGAWGNNTGADPTAHVNIYRPGESDPIVDDGECTGGNSAGGVTPGELDFNAVMYLLDASDTSVFPLGEGYRAEFFFKTIFRTAENTLAERTSIRVVNFDVVRQPLSRYCPLNVDDLKGVHSEFDAALDAQAQHSDGVNQVTYRYILPAWSDVLYYVKSKGRRPSLISSPDELHQLVKYGALRNLCLGLMRSPTDIRARLFEEFDKRYQEAKNTLVLRYADGDGLDVAPVSGWQQPSLSHTPYDREARRLAWRKV